MLLPAQQQQQKQQQQMMAVRMRWEERLIRERAKRKSEVSVVASNLLDEMRVEARLPARPVDKKLLADARLLLMLANGERQPPSPRENAPKAAKLRCGACALCLRGECGKCGNCLDKRKYGGPGARKQACSARQCLFPKPGYREVRALAS